ncbi:MAG: hypothetical protein LBD04_03495 [Synergistaceae bacterium]|nr:hypothetical protein [Synergistaceae bacterium]
MRDGTLLAAPLDTNVEEESRKTTGLRIEFVLTTEADIASALVRADKISSPPKSPAPPKTFGLLTFGLLTFTLWILSPQSPQHEKLLPKSQSLSVTRSRPLWAMFSRGREL